MYICNLGSLLFVVVLFQASFCVANIQRLGGDIIELTNEILGGESFKDHLKQGNKFHSERLQPDIIIKRLAQNIEDKIAAREKAIQRLRKAVIQSYERSFWGQYTECCRYSDYDLELVYDHRFLGKVDVDALCVMRSSMATKIHEIPDDDFLRAASENLKEFPGIKAQYFGSDGGTLLSFPASAVPNCGNYDNRFRPWYVQASAPVAKDVVLVMDMSGSMFEQNRLQAAIHAATTILETLSPDDRVAVVGFSDYAYAVGSELAEVAIAEKNYGGFGNGYSNRDSSCYVTTMVTATPSNLHHLSSAVENMVPHGGTNYTTGLKMAFDFLYNSLKTDITSSCIVGTTSPLEIAHSRHRAIVFLSDGKPSDLPAKILDLIHKRNRDMYNSVVLLTYALGKGTFGHFIEKMAQQDHAPALQDGCDSTRLSTECTVNGSSLCDLPPPKPGLFRQVVDSQYLRSEMGSYYNYFATTSGQDSDEDQSDVDVVWSVPYFDAGGLGMVVTAASSVVLAGRLVGVVGTDLTMREMMAEVEYFHAGGHASYAFLLDGTGRVLLHPYIPSPASVTDDPVLTDIGAFERTKEVKDFLKEVLDHSSEQTDVNKAKIFRSTIHTKRALPQEHRNVQARDAVLSYSCMRIRHLVVCVVLQGDMASHMEFSSQDVPENFHFLYHRFDITPPEGICSYKGSISSGKRSSVFLAPSAFLDVGMHLGQPEASQWISDLGAYVTDTNKYYVGSTPEQLAAEVNLRTGVRDALRITSILEDIWNAKVPETSEQGSGTSQTLSQENLRKNVIFRYFTSQNGVFRIQPGVKMPKTYNPVHRPWYEQAMALLRQEMAPGQNCAVGAATCGDMAAVSQPYLDASGAGVVVTISQAIVAPKHSDSDASQPWHVVGVMAGDMKVKFLEMILMDTVEECKRESGYECILIDLAGYVIYDNTLGGMDETTIEHIVKTNYHLTYAHRVIADELVRQKIMVRQQCADVSKVAYLEEYRLDLERLSDQGSSLPFTMKRINSTNTVLLIIPNDFWLPHYINQKECIEHNHDSAVCDRPEGSNQCESPCVNKKDAAQEYGICSNTFNYTWDGHPPPCLPDKYIDEKFGIIVENEGIATGDNLQISALEPCWNEDMTPPKMMTSSVPLGLAFLYLIATILVKLWL